MGLLIYGLIYNHLLYKLGYHNEVRTCAVVVGGHYRRNDCVCIWKTRLLSTLNFRYLKRLFFNNADMHTHAQIEHMLYGQNSHWKKQL